MTLKVGDRLPEGVIKDSSQQSVDIRELTTGKKVVLFGVPGAFTPTCSSKHLPGYLEKYDELKASGVDVIACLSVNDAFVMAAWGKDTQVGDKILLLADGSAQYTKKLGFELDLTDRGLGIRSRRFSLLAEDGVVKELNLEEGGGFAISDAGTMCSLAARK